MDDILSQEEINNLLAAHAGEGPSHAAPGMSPRGGEIRHYDFAHPERFSKEQVRQLQAVHVGFATSLANHMSAMLRHTVDIRHTTLDQISFDDYLKSIPTPTLTSTFRLDPHGTRCLLELNPGLVFPLIDLLTGGTGDAFVQARDMTDIELKLMEGVLRVALTEYESAWGQFVQVQCPLERAGSNQMVNPIARPRERMLSCHFDVSIAGHNSRLSLCLPAELVESLLDSFIGQPETQQGPTPETMALITDHLTGSSVSVGALLGEVDLTFENLLHLAPGDLVKLGQPVNREIWVTVEGEPKFAAVPGVVDRRLGVHITRELVEDEEDEEHGAGQKAAHCL